MTMKELVTASASNYSREAFLPPEYLKARVTAQLCSESRRPALRRRSLVTLLAAVLALALSVTAVASASGIIRLPALERLFGLAPVATENAAEALAPYIESEIEGWNFLRAEENRRGGSFELGDPRVISDAYRAGMLTVDEIYAMFGMDAPSESALDEALSHFPELEKNEKALRAGAERYAGLSAEGSPVTEDDEAFLLEYAALEYEVRTQRRELSSLLARSLRYENFPESWPERLPAEYRYSAPDIEALSDREKMEALLSGTKSGEGWQCWVLAMDEIIGGYKVKAAFARLVEDEEGARLEDEDGNTVYEFSGGGYPLSDMEAEAFMELLPKWSFTLEKDIHEVTTATGYVKHHYGDNSFTVLSMRKLLLDPGNSFLYESSYEYVEPMADRAANGVIQPPFYPEKLALGQCCFDGEFFGFERLHEFLQAYHAGDPSELTVYTPTGTMFFDASDPAALSVTVTEFDFDSGVARASRSCPTDFSIQDGNFTVWYGNESVSYAVASDDVVIY